MGLSRQEYWSGLLFLPPGDLPNPGMEPLSPALQVDSLPAEPLGKALAESLESVLFFFFKDIYSFTFGCGGSSLLCSGFLQL